MNSVKALKVLTYSTLYPSDVLPTHGVFVETRLRKMLNHVAFESRVVAPVPWFPFSSERFGVRSRFARIDKKEHRYDIEVRHPRYVLVPKVGMTSAPLMLAIGSLRTLLALRREGFDFDVIDAHYFYPDGVAAVLLGAWLNKPVVITARGTDINFIPRYLLPRMQIRWAMRQSAAAITVCEALRVQLIELGMNPEKITTLRNGVDLDLFNPPENRDATRAKLGFEGHTVLSVGHLIERKGHELVIEAVRDLPDTSLVIVGEGEERKRLEGLINQWDLGDRVRLVGAVNQLELRDYYGAADAMVLASSREGWANVLLESMACGTAVVATTAGGTPEVVDAPEAGVLVDRTAVSLHHGIVTLRSAGFAREATRRYAEKFDWRSTAEDAAKILETVAS